MLYRSLELPHSIEAAALGQTPPAAAAPAAPAAAAANETSWLDGLVGPQQIALLEHIGIALGLFVAGWLLAKLASWATYRLLTRADIGKRAATRLGMGKLARGEGDADANKAERVLAKAVYFVLMLLVVVGVLQYAGLTQVAAPIQTLVERVVDALVFLGKAALILAVAYLVAVALEKAVAKLLGGVGLDARFAELSRTDDAEEAEDGAPERPFSEHVGRVLFWLVMIVGLAGALEALNITPISVPLGNAIDKVVGILPSLGVAALLVLAGYVLGKIAAAVVRNILQSAGFDDLVQRLRLDRIFGKTPPSRVVGLFVMIFIILEAVIAALDHDYRVTGH